MQAGKIDDAEMRRTFNMGIGMVLVVDKETASKMLQNEQGSDKMYCIGEVVSGEGVSFQ